MSTVGSTIGTRLANKTALITGATSNTNPV